MKLTCDFCKTEYTTSEPVSGTVRCAVCGNTWTASAPARHHAFLVFFAALIALLAAIVFTVVVVVRTGNNTQQEALVATMGEIQTVTDDDGVAHFVVTGVIENRSDEIYGVPDLIVLSRDANGAVVATQKFMPDATLLDPGAKISFSHTLSAPAAGTAKISVKLQGVDK